MLNSDRKKSAEAVIFVHTMFVCVGLC